MRVLIADHQCKQRVVIDKVLGGLGYFRICHAASFDELISLTNYKPSAYDRFDLLIFNAELVSSAGRDAVDFVVNNARLKHALIYGAHRRSNNLQPLVGHSEHQVRLVDTINYYALVDFFSLVDTRLKYKSKYKILAGFAGAQRSGINQLMSSSH